MKETICFFGASVKQQKNGYAEKLKTHFKDSIVHIFGYGGMHISDAGICFIDNVLESKPDYCFIDFCSTGYMSKDPITIESLNTIVYKFSEAKCRLIFLFFLRENHEMMKEFYEFLKTYINKNHLYYIDLNNYFKYDSAFCKDTVHTTEYGAEQYALKISDMFQQDKPRISLPESIEKTRFCDLKVLNVNKVFSDLVNLVGDCLIIGFHIVIGPNSGNLDVNNKITNIWDIYCHYKRETIKIKNKVVSASSTFTIKILQDKIDYSTCRRPIVETEITKELHIINIYYIGERLEIV